MAVVAHVGKHFFVIALLANTGSLSLTASILIMILCGFNLANVMACNKPHAAA
jgi:hypothetical protein